MSNAISTLQLATAASWRAGLLIVFGAGLGMSINALRPTGVRFAVYVPPSVCTGSAAPNPIHVLQPAQAAKLCGDTRTLVADVRDSAAFTEGHVAGAVHIPCTGSRADVEHVRSRLVGKEALVVYGDSEDQARQVASDLATRIGRPELTISVIAGGWRAWFDAGMACASGPCDDCEGLVSHAPN
jgi:rhodanese-related sulfurtransferase